MKVLRKIIIDVDTGIDDALALAYLAGCQDCELAGVTTTYGNNTLEMTTQNTLDVLHAIGRDDIPVCPGASCPWGETEWVPGEHLHIIHGRNGLGNVRFETSTKKPEALSATEFILDSCRKYGKDLVLAFVGPLTNLADTIQADPETLMLCGGISIMGGALTVKGNITPYAEANIYNDTKAAEYVFRSGVEVRLVGLDTTLKTVVGEEDILPLKETGTACGKRFYEMSHHYFSNEHGVRGGAMHDALAAEAAFNPSVITKWLPVNLCVEQDGPSRGRTTGTQELLNIEKKDQLYALDVDGKQFVKDMMRHIVKVM